MMKFNKLLYKVACVFVLIFAQFKYNIQINHTQIGLLSKLLV